MKTEQPEYTDTALPRDVANVLRTTEGGLAQLRYKGTGPKFIKIGGGERGGGRVLYRWSDVYAYLDERTQRRTNEPRPTLRT
jgi:hypothetical protein